MTERIRDRYGNTWQPPRNGKWPKLKKISPKKVERAEGEATCFVFSRGKDGDMTPVAKRRGTLGLTLGALQKELRKAKLGVLMVTWACGEKEQLDALDRDTSRATKVVALLRALDAPYRRQVKA